MRSRKNRKNRKHSNTKSLLRQRRRQLQLEALEDRRVLAVLYSVNAGGPEIVGDPLWESDNNASPSTYLTATNSNSLGTGATIDTSGVSIPVGTPAAMFQTERFDFPGQTEMSYDFPVTPGDYEVQLYFAETWSGAQAVGVREFDVVIEGITELDDYDIFEDVGGFTGVMHSFVVTADSNIDIDFIRVTQNPAIRGIQIHDMETSQPTTLGASTGAVNFGSVDLGETASEVVTLTNNTTVGGDSITIEPTAATIAAPFSFDFGQTTPIVLAPGESTNVTLTYAPTVAQNDTGQFTVPHSGDNSPLTIDLSGVGGQVVAGQVLYRVNAGGGQVAGDPAWEADNAASQSPYLTATNAGVFTGGGAGVSITDPSIPAGTPVTIFQSERFDFPGQTDMSYDFPVAPGDYEVRLYFAETWSGAQAVGARTFDVDIEGVTVLDDYDIFADVGGFNGVMHSFEVTADSNIDIDFLRVSQNPAIRAIEILTVGSETASSLGSSDSSVSFGSVDLGQTGVTDITLTNNGPTGGDNITIDPTAATLASPFAFDFGQATPIVLAPGESIMVTLSYTPTTAMVDSAVFTVPHDGLSSPLTVDLTGVGGSLTAGEVLYRVNAGGISVADDPAWEIDNNASPSPYFTGTTSSIFGASQPISGSHPSIPLDTPTALFQTERFDAPGGTDMTYDFPVTPGEYEVRLYFAEGWSGAQSIGTRVFDVAIEGETLLDDYDVFADVGGYTAVMHSFTITADANIDIDFLRVNQNPAVRAIEILSVSSQGSTTLGASTSDIQFGNVEIGETATDNVILTNTSGTGGGDITIDPTQAQITPGGSPFDFSFTSTTPIVLAPGESTTVTVTYSPTLESSDAAALQIPHDGTAGSLSVNLTGTGIPEGIASLVQYRINTGGPEILDSPSWLEDTADNPSEYNNLDEGGISNTNTRTTTIAFDASVPENTPMELFQSDRFDLPGAPNLEWDFAVTPGLYEVRLYFVETFAGAFVEGGRLFDIEIEGIVFEDDYDIFADAGANTGVMKSYVVSSDDTIDINFLRETQNPLVSGIEILRVPTGELSPSMQEVDFGPRLLNQTALMEFVLTNDNAPGGPNMTIDPSQASLAGGAEFMFEFEQTTLITLAAGQSTTVTVSYMPGAEEADSATLTIPHSGPNTPLEIAISGTGVTQLPISFDKSLLTNVTGLTRPTSLQFGPDGRLYISQQNGLIRVYDVVKNGANDYQVTQAETISIIQTILNHDDDGTPRPDITTRLVTGILVVGTAENPVIYVGSSDPRIGGGAANGGDPNETVDTNLDTNSSILSRITWNGSEWEKLDLVRGLPRSDEQHAINGMVFDPNDPTLLYVTLGGSTNMGAPSNNFAFLPEYAYSAAILAVDLAAIGETTYDLPTLDDEDQPGVDTSDPFGGNNGKNQAILEPNGPVQLHAVGLRNPYDVVFDENGRMYTIDNGPNAGWGGVPIGEGPEGNATNDINEAGSFTHGDGLHWVSAAGYYGGHPNPTRANMNNTFNETNPQSPTYFNNPIESDYWEPGVEDGSMVVYPSSTNGLAVYNADNFGGSMHGDLLTASFDNTIKRIKLNATGDAVVLSETLFSNVGFRPLDVIAPNTGPYVGSIWVIDVALNSVIIFEPTDINNGTENDRDGDGYTNEDEEANGTNPDNPGDVPADYDMDFISDLLDPDDDNDQILDEVDLFVVDPDNGTTTPIGTFYGWENEGEDLGGILGMGFTGLMNNGVDNWLNQYDPLAVTAGGAAGVFTVDIVGAGTAQGATNTQYQGFHYGFNPVGATDPFSATTRVLAPYGGHVVQPGQEMGLTLGTGDQDNYVKIVLSGNNGGSIEVTSEFGGSDTLEATTPVAFPGPGAVDLWLTIDPLSLTLQASYAIDGGTRTNLGAAIAIPASWVSGVLAAGLTSVDPAQNSLPVTWDHLNVISEPVTTPGEAAAKIELYTTGSINNSSTARVDSFRLYNNSTEGKQITSVVFDLSTTFMPDMLFDPNGTAGDLAGVEMIPNSGELETGQSSHNFSVARDGGFEQLEILFDDFDPSEVFTFRTDVDPTSVQGSAQPGPSNAADVSGLEIAGATVTVTFDDSTTLTGQLFALPEGSTFYLVHSEVVLTEEAIEAAPSISLVGVATPAIVPSASQTVRVTGPVGAAVRLLQTEVALHLEDVPIGGFDIDPFEANKIVMVSDETATIGAGGFVDIPVTLTDSLEAGGITYFSAVIDTVDGRTTNLSNVLQVALNNLPPGSVGVGGNQSPVASGVSLTPDSDTNGPISISATATDTDSDIAAAEYFIDTVGAEGTGTAMNAADGTFNSMSEGLTGTISAAVFNGLSVGEHTVFVRALDSDGAWSTVASATLTKEEEVVVNENILLRINAGGAEVAGQPTPWEEDTAGDPHEYSNADLGSSNSDVLSTAAAIDMSDPSLPAGTPASIFQTSRFDNPGSNDLLLDVPLGVGQYEVRMYFAEIDPNFFGAGLRVFDVVIEDETVLDDFDIYAAAGNAGNKGIMVSFIVDSSSEMDIDFIAETGNPMYSAIEFLDVDTGSLAAFSAPAAFSSAGSSDSESVDEVFASDEAFADDNSDLLLLLAQSSDEEPVAVASGGTSSETEEADDVFAEFGLGSDL